MQKPQKFKGKVSEHLLLNEKFQYIHIELFMPHRIEFEAGQFVTFDVGGENRSYSIANPPLMNHAVEICVDISPGGKGANYLKNLKPGDEVEMLGPLGNFVVEDQEEKLLFIATGSGIAPLRSMIKDLLEAKQSKKEMKLYWGLRFVEDMFWEEDFRRLHKHYDNFRFEMILSRPPKRWPIYSGHVTGIIEEEMSMGEEWGVYLCGSQAMIKDVCEVVEAKGVPRKQIHFEKFF